MARLPFKISAQTKGAQKAYRAFTRRYGGDEGARIFLAKAEETGTGTAIRQQVNNTYKKGAKHDRP